MFFFFVSLLSQKYNQWLDVVNHTGRLFQLINDGQRSAGLWKDGNDFLKLELGGHGSGSVPATGAPCHQSFCLLTGAPRRSCKTGAGQHASRWVLAKVEDFFYHKQLKHMQWRDNFKFEKNLLELMRIIAWLGEIRLKWQTCLISVKCQGTKAAPTPSINSCNSFHNSHIYCIV